MRIFWASFAAVVLVASLAIHVSTFFGVDPMESIPHVMLLHLLIFPPFIAAIAYLRRVRPADLQVPRWMKVCGGVLVVNAVVTGVLFVILGEGGGPHQRDGKFFLMEHGMIIRELTRAEFGQQQAYVVRFFSSGWALFSAIALGALIIARPARAGDGLLPDASPSESPGPGIQPILPPAHTSRAAGLIALLIYVACVTMILTRQPLLNLLCVVPLGTFACIGLRRRTQGFPQGQFDTTFGCLSIVPNFFLAGFWAVRLRQFIYVACYAGLRDAAQNRVQVIESRVAPSHLSNGQALHTQVWAALMIPTFLLVVCGLIGLTFMGEEIGRFLRTWRSGSQSAGRKE